MESGFFIFGKKHEIINVFSVRGITRDNAYKAILLNQSMAKAY